MYFYNIKTNKEQEHNCTICDTCFTRKESYAIHIKLNKFIKTCYYIINFHSLHYVLLTLYNPFFFIFIIFICIIYFYNLNIY